MPKFDVTLRREVKAIMEDAACRRFIAEDSNNVTALCGESP